MPGLVPGIHVSTRLCKQGVDGRDKPGHDGYAGHMTQQEPALAQRYAWPGDDLTVIPDWVYTDETIYAREVERIFHGPTWNYVALEAEIPNAGNYIRSNV